MSLARRGMLALCAWWLAWSAGTPALAGPLYSDANRAYHEQRYSAAVAGYEALIAAGVVHEHVYYNLGNAYFHTGDLGRAAYNYERALVLEPGFDDARHNLALVRQRVAETMSTSPGTSPGTGSRPTSAVLFTTISPGWVIGVFIFANLIFALGLIALRVRPGLARRWRLRMVTGLAGALFVMSAVLLAGRWALDDSAELGVVLPAEVEMREAPDTAPASVSERRSVDMITAGARVRIVDGAPGWLKVRLDSGTEGWLPEDAIGRL